MKPSYSQISEIAVAIGMIFIQTRTLSAVIQESENPVFSAPNGLAQNNSENFAIGIKYSVLPSRHLRLAGAEDLIPDSLWNLYYTIADQLNPLAENSPTHTTTWRFGQDTYRWDSTSKRWDNIDDSSNSRYFNYSNGTFTAIPEPTLYTGGVGLLLIGLGFWWHQNKRVREFKLR